MGGKPKVVKQDPEGDARRAAEKATAEANTKKSHASFRWRWWDECIG